MRTVTTIRFDPTETALCRRALDSITVAYPGYHRQDKSSPDFPSLRAATAAGRSGADLDGDTLNRAAAVFRRQRDACRDQSDPAHWAPVLPDPVDVASAAPGPGSGPGSRPAGGVPLIADPAAVRVMLTETRRAQALDAERALRLVESAAALVRAATPPPDPSGPDDEG